MKYRLVALEKCHGGFGEYQRSLVDENWTPKYFTGGIKSLEKRLNSDNPYNAVFKVTELKGERKFTTVDDIRGRIHNEPDRVYHVVTRQGDPKGFYVGADKRP